MIDLRSDTVTKPSAGMRAAIANAEVGDDVLDGDPTVRKLEQRVAELLGTEAALFFPTGTMANECGIWVLGRAGTELFVHEDAHIVDREKAAAAALAGMQPRLIRGAPRTTVETFKAAVRAPSRYLPRATLLCLENTHNSGGGLVTPLMNSTPSRVQAARLVSRCCSTAPVSGMPRQRLARRSRLSPPAPTQRWSRSAKGSARPLARRSPEAPS